MKLKNIKTRKAEKPAFSVDDWTVIFKTHENRITAIKVTLRGKTKEFKVKNDNVKAAWQKVEKYFKLKY